MYDVIIIGAGAAGMGAAVAASEKKLNTLVISKSFLNSPDEFFGFIDLKKLVKNFHQLVKNRQLELKEIEVIALEKNIVSFSLEVKNGTLYYGKKVVIAVGGESLDFDKITQKTSEGKIRVDNEQKTSVSGIYAVGNCANLKEISQVAAFGEGVKSIEKLG